MKKSSNYDEDGFFVLKPAILGSDARAHAASSGAIGEYKLVLIKPKTMTASTKSRNAPCAVMNVHRRYEVPYAPKTWQRKAWCYVGRDVPWDTFNEFRGLKTASKRIRHIRRVAAMIKVRLSTDFEKTGRPVIDTLVENPKKNRYGMYMVADTPRQFQDMLNRIYAMRHTDAERYYRAALDGHYDNVEYVAKYIIVYDDKSFDSLCGDPCNLHRLLGLDPDRKGCLKIHD